MTLNLPMAAIHKEWLSPPESVSEEPATIVGDYDIGCTYAALGEALSRWQDFELAFATLYARLRGYPSWLEKVRHFGASNPSFQDKIDTIKTAAQNFFAEYGNTDVEADFHALCSDAMAQSIRQNRIAQGLVRNIANAEGAPRVVLELPWHAHDRARRTAAHLLGSEAILKISAAFVQLASQAEALHRRCAALSA